MVTSLVFGIQSITIWRLDNKANVRRMCYHCHHHHLHLHHHQADCDDDVDDDEEEDDDDDDDYIMEIG